MAAQLNVNQFERLASVASGSALIAFGIVRRSGPFSAMAAAAGLPLLWRGATGHCPVYEARGINTAEHPPTLLQSEQPGVPDGKGIAVEHHITINKPVADVFAFWNNFENLPRFMNHLESVTYQDDDTSHWVATAPLGTTVEWDAEIVAISPDEYIHWRSRPGTSVPNEGTVTFAPIDDGNATEVRVKLEYRPPAGAVGATIAKLFGEAPIQQIAEDLRRFKNLLETGEIPTTIGQPSGRKAEQLQERSVG